MACRRVRHPQGFYVTVCDDPPRPDGRAAEEIRRQEAAAAEAARVQAELNRLAAERQAAVQQQQQQLAAAQAQSLKIQQDQAAQVQQLQAAQDQRLASVRLVGDAVTQSLKILGNMQRMGAAPTAAMSAQRKTRRGAPTASASLRIGSGSYAAGSGANFSV